MGNKLFGIDIAKLVHKNMSSMLLDAVLEKVVSGTRTSGSLTSGKNKTETEYTCKGFTDSFEDRRIDGTVIKRGDRKVLLIGDSIQSGAVPEVNDKVTIESKTYRILSIMERDPAAATYVLHCR
jgi:hypothetical protein